MDGRRTPNSRVGLLLLGLVGGLVMVSCAPKTRHSILDFIFDDVPAYVSPEERVRRLAEAAAREAAAPLEHDLAPSREPVEKLAQFVHGPYASKECARCHDLGAASGFRGPGGGGALEQAALEDLAEAGRLRMPVTQLCVHCHAELSQEDASNQGLWLHGPVASGWCVLCHRPHSSRYPRLVHSTPPARLCGQCHVRKDLVAFTPEHRPEDPEHGYPPLPPPDADAGDEGETEPPKVVQVVKDCTRCHDPHRGPDRFILKRVPGLELAGSIRGPVAEAWAAP